MEKYSSRQMLKALKEGLSVLGKKRMLDVSGTTMLQERLAAKGIVDDIINKVNPHHIRIKTDSSIQKHLDAGKTTADMDDIIGMRDYVGRNPSDEVVQKYKDKLTDSGITDLKTSWKKRRNYHGVHVKGTHKNTGVSVEMQLSPNKIADAAQKMQHMIYKDNPKATKIDRFVIDNLSAFMIKNFGFK